MERERRKSNSRGWGGGLEGERGKEENGKVEGEEEGK